MQSLFVELSPYFASKIKRICVILKPNNGDNPFLFRVFRICQPGLLNIVLLIYIGNKKLMQ